MRTNNIYGWLIDGSVCVGIMRVMVVFTYIQMWYVCFAMMVLSTKNGRSQHIRHGGKNPVTGGFLNPIT